MDHPTLPNRILRKAETVIQGRTSRIIVVVERCTDDHNYSAIIRTAEALGVQHVWLIDPPPPDVEDTVNMPPGSYFGVEFHTKKKCWIAVLTAGPVTKTLEGPYATEMDAAKAYDCEAQKHGLKLNFPLKYSADNSHGYSAPSRYQHSIYASMATEWLTIREFKTTTDCIRALRSEGRTIWATDLSQQAVRLTRSGLGVPPSQEALPPKLAVVFGTESVGCSEEILLAADKRVYLPTRGFADSLNLSVAAALVLQALFHMCPGAIACMPEAERAQLRQEWYPKLAAQRSGGKDQQRKLAQLKLKLRDVQYIKDKQELHGAKALSPEQAQKLLGEAGLLLEVDAITEDVHGEARRRVEADLANPPPPLADMRRSNEHRTAFVGKGVRKENAVLWKGLAATANTRSRPP